MSNSSTLEDVIQILGVPDQTGTGVAADITIARYGAIELAFWPNPADEIPTLILMHTDDLPPWGSDSITVVPWIVQGTTGFDDAVRALNDAGIENVSQNRTKIITSSGVNLLFEFDRLAVVSLDFNEFE